MLCCSVECLLCVGCGVCMCETDPLREVFLHVVQHQQVALLLVLATEISFEFRGYKARELAGAHDGGAGRDGAYPLVLQVLTVDIFCSVVEKNKWQVCVFACADVFVGVPVCL